MTLDLARRLLASGAVTARDVEAALYLSVVRGVSLPRALVDRGVLGERALEEELSRKAGLPIRQVAPDPELVARLPRGLCRILGAVPLRTDASGIVDVAAVDSLDTHVASEFSFHLGVPVRLLRATMSGIEEAIRRLELADGATSSRTRRRTPAFPHGAPDTVPPSPPPPSGGEDVPIPLVRRLSAPSFAGFGAPGALVSPPLDTAEALGDLAAEVEPRTEPRPETRPSETRAPEARPEPRPQVPRRALVRDGTLTQPSVSFPSQPPPSAAPDEAGVVETLPPSRRLFATSLSDIGDGDLADGEGPSGQTNGRAASEPSSLLVGEDEPTPHHEQAPEPEGPEPETVPRAPDAGWTPSLPELVMLVRRAPGRDEMLDLVLRALTLVANRVAIFVAKKDGFRGWSCNPAFGSEEELKEVSVSAELPSVLATAAAAGYYLGPIPRTPGHLGLLSVMRTASSDFAVYVVRVKARPTLLLAADELDDTLLGTRALGEIASASSEALTRILTNR
ncbi:MAG: hypothetical protein HOV80_20450 [Polyangiaceae bacterium]|nr:hypothetical protein [Polyangiaceae bacterium]